MAAEPVARSNFYPCRHQAGHHIPHTREALGPNPGYLNLRGYWEYGVPSQAIGHTAPDRDSLAVEELASMTAASYPAFALRSSLLAGMSRIARLAGRWRNCTRLRPAMEPAHENDSQNVPPELGIDRHVRGVSEPAVPRRAQRSRDGAERRRSQDPGLEPCGKRGECGVDRCRPVVAKCTALNIAS
jgi:hypothetical protein